MKCIQYTTVKLPSAKTTPADDERNGGEINKEDAIVITLVQTVILE